MNSNLRQANAYRNRELKQVRRDINEVCLARVGHRVPVLVAQSGDNPNRLYIVVRTPDDVLLRNAITAALAGYDVSWYEERISLGELCFSMDIYYWRILAELDEMKAKKAKSRPRFSFIPRWLRTIFRNPVAEAIESDLAAAYAPAGDGDQMDEGDVC